MTWLMDSLGIAGICFVILGLAIVVCTIDDSQTLRDSRNPIILICLGMIGVSILPSDFPQDQTTPSVLNIGLDVVNISVGILLPWMHILIGLGQELQAGARLLKVGQINQQRRLLWGCLMLIGFGILYTIQSIHEIQQPWFRYNFINASTFYMPIVLWSLAFYYFLKGMDRLELRQKAVTCSLSTLRWNRISSYQWAYGERTSLILRFQPRLPLFLNHWTLTIPASKQEAVNQILVELLPGKAE